MMLRSGSGTGLAEVWMQKSKGEMRRADRDGIVKSFILDEVTRNNSVDVVGKVTLSEHYLQLVLFRS